MKAIQVTEDILSLSELKTQTSRVLRKLKHDGRPVIITQNGKPAAVMITPEAFDRVSEHIHFIAHLEEGLADAEAGRVIDDEELGRELDATFGKLEDDRG